MLNTRSTKGLNVVSLFDGISVGLLALKNLGIPVNSYYTSEINETAIQISKNNHTEDYIYRAGDVRYILGDTYPAIDLLIGGSPCVDFSMAGNRQGMATYNYKVKNYIDYMRLKHSGVNFIGESYLLWEFVRLKREIMPKYFFLENTYMSKHWQDVVSNTLHVEPVLVDSKGFSAQSRVRLYWTNIPFDLSSIPEDSGTYVKDIVMDRVSSTNWVKGKSFYPIKEHRSTRGLKCLGGLVGPKETVWKRTNEEGVLYSPKPETVTKSSQFRQNQRVYSLMGKAPTITKINYALYQFPGYRHRKLLPLELERLQGLPDGYTHGFSDRRRSEAIGNSWNTKTIEFFLKYFKNTLDDHN